MEICSIFQKKLEKVINKLLSRLKVGNFIKKNQKIIKYIVILKEKVIKKYKMNIKNKLNNNNKKNSKWKMVIMMDPSLKNILKKCYEKLECQEIVKVINNKKLIIKKK